MSKLTPAEWSQRYHEAVGRAKTIKVEPPVYCPNCGGKLLVGIAYPPLLGPFANTLARPMLTCEACQLAFSKASVIPREGP